MVNKQYNIQSVSKTKIDDNNFIDKNIIQNVNVITIDNSNRDFNTNNYNNYDNICKMNEKSNENLKNNNYDDSMLARNLSINDIGRFNYILQMDKEMGIHTADTISRLSSDADATVNNTSNSNSVNSDTYNEIHFWKAHSSQSAIASNARRRKQKFLRYLKIFWKYAKWPLAVILISCIIGIILYFVLTQQQSQDNSIQKDSLISKNTISLTNVNSIDSSTVEQRNSLDSDLTQLILSNSNTTFPLSFNESVTRSTVDDVDADADQPNDDWSNLDHFVIDKIHINSKEFRTSTEEDTELKTDNKNLEVIMTKQKLGGTQNRDYDNPSSKLLYPSKETLKKFGFTSGHQNNFGIPIEEDERILRMLNQDLLDQNNDNLQLNFSTTDANSFKILVSPTLPAPPKNSFTTENIRIKNVTTDDGLCVSTSLHLCQDILQYDLTVSTNKDDLTELDIEHFQYLINSNCSSRAAQFICSALEPECRPTRMGSLDPCRRICKSILESCGHIIAASEILTNIFDCDIYPDSDDVNICEDPTKNTDCNVNEFQCHDKTCIPIQWKCDNIKDCSEAEDEENCVFCEENEFRCFGTDKCIPENLRCNNIDDCPEADDELDCYDNEDDLDELETTSSLYDNIRLYAFVQDQNPKSPAYLTVSNEDEFKPENLENIENVTKSVNDANTSTVSILKSLIDSVLESNEKDDIESAASELTVPISKTLANFQDSKEIMMTSDSEADYKYSDTNNVPVRTYMTPSCPIGELRCINGKCITVSQLCDKIVDCPDEADEKMCIYKE